jgi:hypothetical protein
MHTPALETYKVPKIMIQIIFYDMKKEKKNSRPLSSTTRMGRVEDDTNAIIRAHCKNNKNNHKPQYCKSCYSCSWTHSLIQNTHHHPEIHYIFNQ